MPIAILPGQDMNMALLHSSTKPGSIGLGVRVDAPDLSKSHRSRCDQPAITRRATASARALRRISSRSTLSLGP